MMRNTQQMTALMNGITKLQGEVEMADSEIMELRNLLQRGEQATTTTKNMAELKRTYNILKNLKRNLDQLQFGADPDSTLMREYKQVTARMRDVLGIKLRRSAMASAGRLPVGMQVTDAQEVVATEMEPSNERLHAEPTQLSTAPAETQISDGGSPLLGNTK